MSDPIRVKTRSVEDLRTWIITQGQFSPCGTELMECLVHIDELRASQPSASNLEQTTLGIAEALPPSDGEIEEWADQSDLIPDEEFVCDEQYGLAAPPPAPACDGEQNVHRELAQWLEQHRQPAPPPAPAPIDIDALLSPEGAYELGTGQEDGAQLVNGPHGPEWWVPLYGCDTLDNLLDRIRTRILPHLRPPVAGIDIPGCDGDYGDVMDLCAAEGVDPRVGVPLLKRAQEAWGVAALPLAPTPVPSLDAESLQEVWIKAWKTGPPDCEKSGWTAWATLSDYIALALEAQRAPSGNPPATEEYLAEARQEVAEFSNELLACRLQNLARVQARDGREYSAALCARAAELISPASDGEREKQAQVQQEGVRRG